jgi:hypothetical protein
MRRSFAEVAIRRAGVFDSSGRLTVNPKCGGTTYADT